MLRTIRLPLALIAIAGLLSVPVAARRVDYRQFVVFGDSLSDTGNVFLLSTVLGATPALPPSVAPNQTYFAGRFSNGPVAFEYFWDRLQPGPFEPIAPVFAELQLPPRGAVSMAFGATGSGFTTEVQGVDLPGLLGQIAILNSLAGGQLPPDALYAVFTGANDYIVTPGETPLTPTEVVGNIVTGIRQLYALGARDIIVLNLPDLGLAPIADPGSQAAALLSLAVRSHNALLAAQLAALPAQLPGIRIVPIDVFGLVEDLPPAVNFSTPALDALVPVTPSGIPASRCIFIAPAACPNVPRFNVSHTFFFWDAEHPTTAMHARLGKHIRDVVGKVLGQ